MMPLAGHRAPWVRTGGTETRALIRRKECAEITARPGRGWCDGSRRLLTQGEAGPGGVAGTQGTGSKRVKRVCPEKRSLGGGGYNDVSKRHVEEGLPYSGGDSEDTTSTEGQRHREGKSQFWHPRHGLVR